MPDHNPWDIYAEQLITLGYGHPLWHPEPRDGREVLIGDVGWLKEGEFRPLFNSMGRADEDNDRHKGVPRHFVTFNPQNVSIGTFARITTDVLHSRSVQRAEVGVEGESSGVAPASVKPGFKFKLTENAGAFLLLETPGQSVVIESRRLVVNYMHDNFDHWREFANGADSWDLDLKEQDIIFVYGTMKTSRWAVAAFDGNLKNKEGYVSGDFGPSASTPFSVHMSDSNVPAAHLRHGPLQSDASPDGSLPANQCLFIHYYKMKRRLFWWRGAIRAAAGPHQLPPGDKDADMPPVPSAGIAMDELEPELVTQASGAYDPVNDLLDYILLRSKADIAIASNLDLLAIFADRGFPTNIMAALLELAPQIEVDERGVGTIVAETHIRQKRNNKDDLEEPASAAKPPRAIPEPNNTRSISNHMNARSKLRDTTIVESSKPLSILAGPSHMATSSAEEERVVMRFDPGRSSMWWKELFEQVQIFLHNNPRPRRTGAAIVSNDKHTAVGSSGWTASADLRVAHGKAIRVA